LDRWQSAKNSTLRRAFEARKRLSIPRDQPVNVYDVCSSIGIEVRFVDCKSLEGMYCREPRTIIFLPSTNHRPRGRVAYTCAHELGHHELGHGTRADKYVNGPSTDTKQSPEEFAANIFAAHFLMPRQAVLSATKARDWEVAEILPEQVFAIASVFGVGYESLLWQLSTGLQLLPQNRLAGLSKYAPKSIRKSVWQASADSGLVLLDNLWRSVTVDLELGDFLATNSDASFDTDLLALQSEGNGRRIWKAVDIGTAQQAGTIAEALIRVSRRGYVGAWRYRYLAEDCD